MALIINGRRDILNHRLDRRLDDSRRRAGEIGFAGTGLL